MIWTPFSRRRNENLVSYGAQTPQHKCEQEVEVEQLRQEQVKKPLIGTEILPNQLQISDKGWGDKGII